MDKEELKIVKKFLKYYDDELPVYVSDLKDFIKQCKKNVVHMDDESLKEWISEWVDDYFIKNEKKIDPFHDGRYITMSDIAIENRKLEIFNEIKDDGRTQKGPVFSHYIGGACEISIEKFNFKYDIFDAYYTKIGGSFKVDY